MHKTAAKRTNIVRRALRAALTSKMTAPLYRGRGLLLLAVIFVLGSTPVFVFSKNNAQAATSSHLNFQSRLQNIAGNTVADGLYDVEFKLYDAASGGANVWTETRTGANRVRVVGGYMSVNLGSVSAFPAINWDQDLWLTMNVDNDGEMNPRMKLTAVPYAFQAQSASRIAKQDGGFDGTVDFTTLTNDRSILLPDASGIVCLSIGNCGGTGDISNGGNSNGTDIVIGTNDAFNLSFETDGVLRVTLDTNGDLDLLTGGLQTNGVTRLTNAGVLQNITGLQVASGGASIVGGVDNNSGGITEAGDITGVGTNLTAAAALNVSSTGVGSDLTLSSPDQILLNAGTTIELQDNTNLAGNLTLTGTGSIIGPDYIDFDTSTSNPAYQEGRLFYDNTQKALSYYNSEAAVTMNIGQENYIYVYNSTGSTIGDGQAVYITGSNLGVPTIGLARANNATTANAVGVATHSIENNTFGFVTNFGEINNINTSSFAAGDNLYLSAATAGALTNTRPALPNYTTAIGRVTEVNATTGKILVIIGSMRNGAFTTGKIAFGLADGSLSQNTNFHWDNTNSRLGIGDATPLATLTVGNGDLFQVAGATGSITTAGTLAVNGGAISSTGALSVTSGSGGLTLDSGTNTLIIAANDTTLQRTASGTFFIDLADGGNTVLQLQNLGAGVADLNLADGGLQVNGTPVLTNGRALQNLTGISSTGTITLNSFGGVAGILQVNSSGVLSVATAGTGYEVPLTFSNGLTRTSNNITLGGTLSGATTLTQAGNSLSIAGGVISLNDAVNFSTSINTGSSTGTVTIGGGSAPLVINSTAFDVTNTGDVSGVATLVLSGAITGATTTDTINGIIINAGSISSIDGFSQLAGDFAYTNALGQFSINSDAFDVTDSGAISGITTLSLSGAISGGTTYTGSGVINTTGGAFQTNSVDRIENDGDLVNIGNLTATGALTITNAGAGSDITLNSIDQIILNAGTLIELQDNTNIGGNIDISGTILAGTNNSFSVDSDGDITSTFIALPATDTANGGSGLGTSTSLTLNDASDFDIGNYIQMNSANCGGTGINPCYAKITNKTGNNLTITPALRWTNGSTVNEYHIPELGGTNTGSTLTNRYGRGYFIAGVATGNGTTFYNEDGIESSLDTFNLLNSGVTTLNIGGSATNLTIGNSNTTVSIQGSLQTAAAETITAGGGLIVSSGGIDNNSGGITEAGSISGLTGLTFVSGNINLNAGGITNAGTISGVAGVTLSSGDITVGGGNIAGVTNITATGITQTATLNATSTIQLNGNDINLAGTLTNVAYENQANNFTEANTFSAVGLALSVTNNASIGGSVGIGAAPSAYKLTVNAGAGLGLAVVGTGYSTMGVDINNSAYGYFRPVLTNDTTSRFEIGAYDLNGVSQGGRALVLNSLGGNVGVGGDLTPDGLFSVGSASQFQVDNDGVITASTATNTINGLVINSGSLSSVTGFAQTSGNFDINGNGTFGTGTGAISLNGATTVTGANTFTVNGGLTSLNGGLNTLGSVRFGDITNNVSISSTGDLQFNGTGDYLVGPDRYAFRYAAAENFGLKFNAVNGRYDFTDAAGAAIFMVDAGVGNLTTTGNLTVNGIDNNSTGLTEVGSIAGATTINASGLITSSGNLVQATATGAAVIIDRTDGVIGSLKSGAAKVAFFYDDTGSFSISKDTRANISSGTGAGIDVLNISSAGNITAIGSLSGLTTLNLSGAISGATATNTINGLVINAGALSGISTIATSSTINGQTISSTANFTGSLTAAGLTTLNGNLALQTGDTFTINGEAFTDLTGNGHIFSGGLLTIDATTAGTVAGTGSNSGLVVAADGLSLLRGCANNQILKWSTTGPQWNCAADATGISDARLKKNVVSINENVLDKIRAVQLYEFDYDCEHVAFDSMHCDTEHQEAGVLAQELAQLFPGLVTSVNGYYQVDYGALSLLNLKAVGELANKVDNLEANTQANDIVTNNTLRLSSDGALQNITGLDLVSGGASVVGGINNNLGGLASAGAISGATSISAESLVLTGNGATAIAIGATNGQTADIMTIKDTAGTVFARFMASGAFRLDTNSTTALQINNAGGSSAFTVDTVGNIVRVGSAVNDGVAVALVLDSKNTEGDPNGVAGAMYYNSVAQAFRCFEDGAWKNCISRTDVTKNNDQIVTDSSSLQKISELSFNALANATYSFDGSIIYEASSINSDISYTFSIPLGASVTIASDAPTGNGSNVSLAICNQTVSEQVCTINIENNNTRAAIRLKGTVVTSSTGGAIQFSAALAQDTEGAGEYIKIFRGSSISYNRTQ